jgi:hypothetical protein
VEQERMRPEEHSALIANISKAVSRIMTERAKRDGYNATVTWRLMDNEERSDANARNDDGRQLLHVETAR